MVVGSASLVAITGVVVPVGLQVAGVPLIFAAITGVGLAVGGYGGLARAAGVRPHAVFLTRPRTLDFAWLAAGAGLATVVPISLVITGWEVTVVNPLTSPRFPAVVGSALAIGLWTATIEEGLLRGYLLAVLGARWRWDGAILASATVFGGLHVGAATSLPGRWLAVAVTGLAGGWFALVTVRAGSIWPSVGLHAGWNGLFALVALSPGAGADAILRVSGSDPSLLLGGASGSPTTAPIVLAMFAALLLMSYWRWNPCLRPADPAADNSAGDAPTECHTSRHTD